MDISYFIGSLFFNQLCEGSPYTLLGFENLSDDCSWQSRGDF
jgi:hypothetical protein